MSYICREENGEYICESDREVELKKLKESVIRELLERIVEDLEIEMEFPGVGKGKATVKFKNKP
jgi:hypothetical protein